MAPPFDPILTLHRAVSFPELPSLRHYHCKPWIHHRPGRHHYRRRRPIGPAPSSRRQLLWALYPNYFSRRVAVYAADRAQFTATDTAGAFNDQLLRTSRLQQRPYRPRKPQRQPFALGVPQHSHSRPPIAFYWASSFTSAPTTSSADTTTPPPWAWRASRYPLKTTLSITIRTVVEDLHHAFPQRAWL